MKKVLIAVFGMLLSAPLTGLAQRAAMPVITPSSGTYTSVQSISIGTATVGATICYRVNGPPSSVIPGTCGIDSITYTGSFTVSVSQSISALATKAGLTESFSSTNNYVIVPILASPIVSPVGGTYTSAQLAVVTATAGATICYAINGTPSAAVAGTCDAGSTTYSAPISIGVSQSVSVLATEAGFTNSPVVVNNYVINIPANAGVNGYCTQGGTQSLTSSLKSTNYLQGIVIGCTISVYLTGTTTPAPYALTPNGGLQTGPFTANTYGSLNPGAFLFFAPVGTGLDVVASGGIPPNSYPQPITILTDIVPGGGGSGGGGGGGAACTGSIGQILALGSGGSCFGTPTDWNQVNLGDYTSTAPWIFDSQSSSSVPVIVRGASGGSITPTFVQGVANDMSEGFGTCNATLTGVVAGHTILFFDDHVSDSPTAGDNHGNTYTLNQNGPVGAIFSHANSPGGTVEVTITNAAEVNGCWAEEWANTDAISPVDVAVIVQNSATTGPITTNFPNEILVSEVISDGTYTAPSGYTATWTGTGLSGGGTVQGAGQAVSSSGTYSATWTGSLSSVVLSFMVGLKDLGSTPQSADLLQYQDVDHNVLAGVNGLGQHYDPSTAGLPTNTPETGTYPWCFDSSDNTPCYWNGTAWVHIGAGAGTIGGTVSAPFIPKATGADTIGNSLLSDSGTVLNYAGTGGLSLTGPSGVGASATLTEGTEGCTPATGIDCLWSNIATHRITQNPNNIGELMVPGVATAGTPAHLVVFSSNGIDLTDGGAPGACATCVVATTPGVGIAHFAGSTQTVTSSAVGLASADVTGILPPANGGTGTSTAPTDTQLLIGQTGGGYLPKTASGSCTVSDTGVFSCSGGGGSIDVNAASVSSPNFNDTTPSPLITSNSIYSSNVKWQVSGSSVSAYVPFLYWNGSDAVSFAPNTSDTMAGNSNTMFGVAAGGGNSTSSSANVAMGSGALYNAGGNNNVSIGYYSIHSTGTSSNNTAVGYRAGNGDDGSLFYSNSVFIGYGTGNHNSSFTNSIAIGYQALGTASNQAVLGNSSITQTILQGIITSGTIFSAAGTALPSCASGIKGSQAVVSDATSPTYMGAYTSGGAITADVICSYNGSTYAWLTH